MPKAPLRCVAAALAALSMAALAAGVYLAIDGRQSLGDWQLQSLGVGLPAALLGLLLIWHQPRNRIAWIFSAGGLAFGLGLASLSILAHGGLPSWLERAAFSELCLLSGLLTFVWVSLILRFPDGLFHRVLWRRFALVACGLCLAVSIVQFLFAPPGFLPPHYAADAPQWLGGPLSLGSSGRLTVEMADMLNLLLPFASVAGLVDRYRTSEPSRRQQIKWLLFAVAIQVIVQAGLLSVLSGLGIEVPALVTLLLSPLPSIGAGLAIFRYRLYDVDRLISRTAAFALLWAPTAAGFAAIGVAAGLAVGGRDLRITTTLVVALVVTLAVQPLRHRLERVITRLVYGERPRGYAAFAGLSEALHGAVPLSELSSAVASTVRDAVGAPWAGVWLRVQADVRSGLRLAGSAGDAALPSFLQEDASGLPETPGALVPLSAGDEDIGFLACGRRDGQLLTEDDHELVKLVARQSTLVLRNVRLERELRERLCELRESRQRLVAAQDQERRHLERDLHDGVQQQLVSLAAKLRQASGSSRSRRLLQEFAAEAEEAVFALQDLARGIYPSVLADQGLAAALRAHAVRVPLQVRVEVEPGLAERRVEPEIEAALYFVALEAVTNAQKHAGTPSVTVTLRSETSRPGLVVEVHDNGRGFGSNSGAGTGVQNMRDRMAALGGSLSVDSQPGAGTWVRAFVPLAAEVIPLATSDRAVRPRLAG